MNSVGEMESRPKPKPLVLLFAATGLIQGLVWVILAFLAILAYKDVLDIPVELKVTNVTHDEYIASVFKLVYFSEDDEFYKEVNVKVNIDSDNLAIFTAFYLGISIVWTITSAVLLYFARFSNEMGVYVCSLGYSGIVTIVTVVDLTLMSLLMADYSTVYDYASQTGVSYTVLSYWLLVIGIMFTLAGRGYVLLLVNIGSAIYFASFYFMKKSKINTERDRAILYNIPIDAYKEHPGRNNLAEAFNDDVEWSFARNNNAFIFDDAQSPPQTPTRPQVTPRQPAAQQQVTPRQPPAPPQAPLWLGPSTQRAATPEVEPETRQPATTSPYALPNKVIPKPPPPMPPAKPAKKVTKPAKPQGKKGPPIPFPDYSPPESPKELRSVIKPHSSYY